MAAAMEPLDLTKAPPRSPYAQLGGLYMLARTIDKMRALLPGGNSGAYQVAGFSTIMLEALGLHADDMQAVVALASSDEDVLAWVHKHSDPAKFTEVNAMLERRTVAERLGDADFLVKYPFAKTLPPQTPRMRLLELDDAQSFANA
jgi:hypothetical protein